MRLDDFKPSSNVEDRRGMNFPGGGGGLGIGTVIVVGLLGWALGINPMTLLGGLEALQGSGQQQTTQGRKGPPDDQVAQFAAKVLATTEQVWTDQFRQQGRTYTKPTMVLFSGRVQSACGDASAAVGPFYCPVDQKIYLDLDFFKELATRFGAPGDFASAYVIAHEVGHHVQNLIGILPKLQQAQRNAATQREANGISVRSELMADCLAGVWANHANANYRVLEPGDVDEGMKAAAAVGDDRLQRQATGTVVRDNFTHGSSQQRVTWFMRGLKAGNMNQCNTLQGTP